jgi:hypothetical protein
VLDELGRSAARARTARQCLAPHPCRARCLDGFSSG